MLCTILFHEPPDSVTSPEATLSGLISGATSGVGLGDEETIGVGERVGAEPRLPLVSSTLLVPEEQATKATDANKTTDSIINAALVLLYAAQLYRRASAL